MPAKTCETCEHEHADPVACQHCDPGLSTWKPKLAAQLAEKDRIIKGLVEPLRIFLNEHACPRCECTACLAARAAIAEAEKLKGK